MGSISTITQQQIFDLRTMSVQNYFDRDSMLTATIPSGINGYNNGVAGDAVPYTIGNDDIMSIILLVCLVVVTISVSRSREFISKQIRNFFYVQYDSEAITETSTELRFQFIMVLINILLLGIASYIYITETIVHPFKIGDNYGLMGIMTAIFFAFFLIKWLIISIVNITFFDSKKNIQWMHLQLFFHAMEGGLMFPLVLLLVYFNFDAEKALFCFVIILILNKLLTFYKCWSIFFRQNGGILQTFLYFCALEITPLLAFAGAWLAMTDFLKVNF